MYMNFSFSVLYSSQWITRLEFFLIIWISFEVYFFCLIVGYQERDGGSWICYGYVAPALLFGCHRKIYEVLFYRFLEFFFAYRLTGSYFLLIGWKLFHYCLKKLCWMGQIRKHHYFMIGNKIWLLRHFKLSKNIDVLNGYNLLVEYYL